MLISEKTPVGELALFKFIRNHDPKYNNSYMGNGTITETVKRLKQGDILAFNELFEEYGRRLYGFIYKYLKSDEDTEDLVQNVFFKIWRNRERLDVDKSFHSYIFTIAFNEIRLYFRQKAILIDIDDVESHFHEKTTEQQVSYNIALSGIRTLVSGLPGRQREIFELSRFDHLSADEIAQKLNISPKTVHNQISKTIRFLRENIGDNIGTGLLFALFFV